MKWFSELDVDGIPGFLGAPPPADRTCGTRVIVVAISSMDGRGAISGKSGGLGNDADLRLLTSLRETADVIVVGASTVRAEGYCGVGRDRATALFGGPADDRPIPPIAVLTREFDLDPESRFFTDAAVPPIVIGPSSSAGVGAAPARQADPARVGTLVRAGAEMVLLDDTDPASVVGALAGRGFGRIVVEGGPSVYRAFFEAGVVDEVFLTIAPVVVGAAPATFGGDHPAAEPASEPAADATALPATFVAESAAFSDSHLFVRYVRATGG